MEVGLPAPGKQPLPKTDDGGKREGEIKVEGEHSKKESEESMRVPLT